MATSVVPKDDLPQPKPPRRSLRVAGIGLAAGSFLFAVAVLPTPWGWWDWGGWDAGTRGNLGASIIGGLIVALAFYVQDQVDQRRHAVQQQKREQNLNEAVSRLLEPTMDAVALTIASERKAFLDWAIGHWVTDDGLRGSSMFTVVDLTRSAMYGQQNMCQPLMRSDGSIQEPTAVEWNAMHAGVLVAGVLEQRGLTDLPPRREWLRQRGVAPVFEHAQTRLGWIVGSLIGENDLAHAERVLAWSEMLEVAAADPFRAEARHLVASVVSWKFPGHDGSVRAFMRGLHPDTPFPVDELFCDLDDFVPWLRAEVMRVSHARTIHVPV